MADDTKGSALYRSGLSENEAKEVHGWFMSSFAVYILFAIAAHAFVWMWRPWLQN